MTEDPFMQCGIAPVATLAVQGTLALYYQQAAHRVSPFPSDLPSEGRPLHFFRGMLHFEPGPAFLETLEREGFQVHVFKFLPEVEKEPLRNPLEDVADIVDSFADRPDQIGTNSVFVGHSAGGIPCYLLASLVKGGNVEGIREAIPRLRRRSRRDLERLADRLSGARFIGIATPFNGVELNRVGRFLNRHLVEPRAPGLFTAITRSQLTELYQKVGRRPEEVIDGFIYSAAAPLSLEGGPVSLATIGVVQGTLRVFSLFSENRSPGDGIVPVASALLAGDVREASLRMNHLRLVETEEGARTLIDVIRTLGGFAGAWRPSSKRSGGSVRQEPPLISS